MKRPAPRSLFSLLLALLLLAPGAQAQEDDDLAAAIAALRLRELGPAVMGGRIADIAVHPDDDSTWYVAVGSGGLWKTENSGVTWTPIFDDQPSYSIGVVALDPTEPNVVWVGTGENVSGRHVGWGSGLYRSRDAGNSWEHVGLEGSEHIGKVLVDPRNGNVVFAAAEGPLWSSGGQRGLFRSLDGGDSWEPVLTVDEDTGITDVEFAPDDPDVLYAAAYQRRRSVAAFLGGGPGSGIYKSTDGGDSWRRIGRGLPNEDMGKIGLAVTPADPSRVYATIEASPEERGFYRSDDRGESWSRRNSYISGGTGPHYYQEIEASPVNADVVYQMDVFVQVTRDGGDTFGNLETARDKHSDNHALWIDPDDPEHLLAGTDGGLYESFDEGRTFRHFPNLPISQFYKVALDNAEPFFHVLGGAQDLGTLWGPSRTTHAEGIRNQDWYVPMGADGYGVDFDPEDPDTLYLMTQVGNLSRVDRRSEEAVDIQPQPAPGEEPERFNWDSPLLVSPHDPHRLWFGSQRVWRSDDRGDSWTAVSGDLTRDLNRYELEIMERVWSVDSLWDHGAMSNYSTLSAISESPIVEGLLYTGSDDGRIHVSEDGGGAWRAAPDLPGVPERYFVNDVEASQHDPDGVFVAVDAHKVGDYAPYLFASDDRGASWRSISGDLPEGVIVWAVQQDHVNPDLLFAAAENGIYTTLDGGERWHRLAGAPTIAFRDLKLHRRDDDLVGATFGRGFWVLDDYSPLRTLAESQGDAALYPVRDAWWYVPNDPMQARGMPSQGTDSWRAPNPPFGATFTFRVDEVPETTAERRRAAEREARDAGEDASFPGWEALRAEAAEREPRLFLTVRDGAGEPVRRLEAAARAGVQRVSWDLRRPAPGPVDLSSPGFRPPWVGDPQGALVAPGVYTVELTMVSGDGVSTLAGPEEFMVKPVPTAPEGTDFGRTADFQRQAGDLVRETSSVGAAIGEARERLRYMRAALVDTPQADATLFARIERISSQLDALQLRLFGDPIRGRLNEPATPSIAGRAGRVFGNTIATRTEPTATQRQSLEIAQRDFGALRPELLEALERLAELEADLEAAGAPWTRGRRIVVR